MKITEYVKYDQHRTFLYEGLDSNTINEAREWERILRPIFEAQLTPDQINSLFQQAQQTATDGGANRTSIGKGVDATKAAGEAFEKVKAAMQNSGPIQGFEAQYDQLAAKLKEKTGGDQGVMQYVQKYRDFATKHPVAQKVIYAAAIAALGALAVGGSIAAVSGGPIVLGLFKMTDRLLQGDKLTSAAWQGVKVAGGAAAAVGVGKAVRGALGLGAPTGAGNVRMGATSSTADLGDQPTARTSKIVNRPGDFSDQPVNRGLTTNPKKIGGLYHGGGFGDDVPPAKAPAAAPTIKNPQFDPMGNYTGVDAEVPAAPKAAPQSTGATAKPQAAPPAEPELKGKALADKRAADMAKAAAAGADGRTPTTGGAATIEPGANTTAAVNNSIKQALANISPKADIGVAAQTASNTLKDMVKQGLITDKWSYDAAYKGLTNGIGDKFGGGLFQTQAGVAMRSQGLPLGNAVDKWITDNGGTIGKSGVSADIDARIKAKGPSDPDGFPVKRGATSNPADFESAYEARLREELSISRKLPKSQITEMFRQVDEGVWDAVKKGAGAAAGAVASGAKAVAGSRIGQAVGATAKDAAGAVAQKVGTVATNMTTKVTSDKLMKAWKAAGSPTDSAEVYKLMKAQGLDDTTLNNIFKAAKIPLTPTQGAGFNVKLPQKPTAAPTPAPTAAPQAAAPPLGQQKDDWKARRDAQWKKKQDAAKGIHTITKPGGKLNEEPADDVPLNKAAINKILMAVAQAGAGGGSPQQQAPQQSAQNSGAQQQQSPQGSSNSRQAAPQQQEPTSSGQAAPQQSASASGSGYSGPDVPLNKAAINKILMAVAQAGA